MIDHDMANRLEAIRSRTGLSMAEQIRRAIDAWLDSGDTTEAAGIPATDHADETSRPPRRARWPAAS